MKLSQAKWSQLTAGLAILLNVIGVTAWWVNSPDPLTWAATWEALGWNLTVTPVLAVLGALILTRRPGNAVGWLFLIGALGSANPVEFFLPTSQPTGITPGLFLLLWLDGWSWIPPIFALFLIPLYFPTGQLPTLRWRWLPWLSVVMGVVFAFFMIFIKEIGPINEQWEPVPNPIGFIPLDGWGNVIWVVWAAGLLTMLGSSVFSLVGRYRYSSAVERQQIKWLLAAGAQFFVIYSLTFISVESSEDSSWSTINYLFLPSIMAIPAAVAVAILRYRLYDIDIIIRKTLVYSVLSGLLILVYFGLVVVLQTLFEAFTGRQSPLVIVVSTLAIAALFNPLRSRLQTLIDRRFYRHKYDAQRVLGGFARSARDEVSVRALQSSLVEAVEETLRPEQVNIWLRPDDGKARI